MDPLKKLTVGLVLSGSLNIVLAFGLFTVWTKTPEPFLHRHDMPDSSKTASGHTKTQLIGELAHIPFQQLVLLLQDKTPVEDGYAKRDFALASLVAAHDFDIHRALFGISLQPRKLISGSDECILFSGLGDEQFQRLIDFAATESWPFTARGLHKELPQSQDAFVMTPQYLAIEAKLQTQHLFVSRSSTLDLLAALPWSDVDALATDHRNLEEWLLSQSTPAAAEVVVTCLPKASIKRLDDTKVIELLKKLKAKNAKTQEFAKELLLSPRSKRVWQAAAFRLYEARGESPPAQFDYVATLKHFVSKEDLQEKLKLTRTAVPKKTAAKPVAAPRMHIVSDGESLWTIAKRYKVSSSALMKANNLKSDVIRKGQTLTIPPAS